MRIKEICKVADTTCMAQLFFIFILALSLNANKTMQTLQYEKAVSSYVNVISKKIAEQFDKNMPTYKRKNLSIQIKPIINLYNPKKSSVATQKIAENLLHEMFLKGFKMLDSGAKNVHCEMLGTYINYKNGMLINARVVDKASGEVYTSAQVFVSKNELKRINKIYNKYSWFSQD